MIEAQIWKHMMTMMTTVPMPIIVLMMMSKSGNIFLVKKTFLHVVKMLKYSPIWSPCEVQEPNFNLQLCESWGHCLRSTWDHHVDDDDDGDDDEDDEDDEDEDDDEPKTSFKIAQNRVCCSLGYIFRYIAPPNFSEKVLWVYSHLKSEFFSDNIGQKLT